MDKTLFAELVESMTQMDRIVRGEQAPSREFHLTVGDVKSIREASGLSQSRFADVIHVDVATLRNWEQGRRQPSGPARVLLEVLRVNPRAVLEAVNVAPDMASTRSRPASPGRSARKVAKKASTRADKSV